MQVFRFVDPANPSTVRLNLNNPLQWLVGGGTNLGGDNSELTTLRQSGFDAAELAGVDLLPVLMTIEVILMPQLTAAAIETAINALNVEAARLVNCLEYLPNGLSGTTWLMDTFRFNRVSVHDGRSWPTQWSKKDGRLFSLQIVRQPLMRGRGAMI